jgi:hypothetical protein
VQAIDELANYQAQHIVLTTETHYALVHLSGNSLRISRVYPIHNANSQNRASDMAELVLFYAHAALTRSWDPSPQPPVSIFRVSVPSFSPSIFKPSQGFIHVGGTLVRPVKFSALRRPSGRLFPQLLSLGVDGFCGHSRHDGEIVISFVRLTFLLFEARAVAKAAYGPSASERLHRELDVYNVLRPLQGASIPTLFGLYWNHNDGSSVLFTSHGGTPIRDFDTLTLIERFASYLSRINRRSHCKTGMASCRTSSVSTTQVFNTTIWSLATLLSLSRWAPLLLILTAPLWIIAAKARLVVNSANSLGA